MRITEFLNLWLKDIILVFIFLSIVEIMIPKGNMKKYINMIIGFLIIITIINPFVKLFNRDYSFNKDLYKNQIENINILYEGNDELIKTQEEQVKEFYTEKIEEELEDLIISTTDYTIERVNTTIDEEEESFGRLLTIEIFLKEKVKTEEEKDNIIKIKKVDNISITENKGNDTKYNELNDGKIKKDISEYYNLPEEKVKIFLNNKGEGKSDG
jgi:stage III sporulation protein AF